MSSILHKASSNHLHERECSWFLFRRKGPPFKLREVYYMTRLVYKWNILDFGLWLLLFDL